MYLGTNLDNALVLIACAAGQQRARGRAAAALILAGLVVLAASLALSEALDDFAAMPLNLLGLVPLALGLRALRQGHEDDGAASAGFWAMTGLALSNSSDTLATLVSFLAERPDAVRWPVSLGYVAGLGALALGIGLLLDRVARWPWLAKWAARIGPLIMIGFGLYILLNTPGDKL
ncbi:MAG: hypothetical protein OIF40_17200 [Mangrovicoccus sp.]|nr:hypothetical protein [Mangrovicoccus sp.]